MTTLPISFRALALKQAGAPVSLEQKTVTSLADDEVLIRVSHASINKMDPMLGLRNIFNLPEPYVLGFDFSGVVVGTGEHVFGRLLRGGGFAEYAVAKKEHVLPTGSMPLAEASTLGIAYMTAYESLVTTADIGRHKGEWIYIAGGGGGLGHFAVQIAKALGLRVIGSAGKASTLALLGQLNVDHIIDYTKQDVIEEIMRFTAGKGVDLVYDSTNSGESYAQSVAVIARGGEYIRLGTAQQLKQFGKEDLTAQVEARGAKMLIGDAGRYSVDPVYIARRSKLMDGLRQAISWYAEGKLKPSITATVPFDAAALQRAFAEFIQGNNNVGKVVVNCA